jgi:hypothetical protein
MSKKSIAVFLVISVLGLGLVSPAFAQQQQPSENQGFFGMFASFFSRMFHPNGEQNNQNMLQGNQNNPTDEPSGTPSGQPQMGEDRLQGLVTAGKITQAQEQEIVAEVAKIQQEITSWSQSTGINAGYIYGGLRGPGMDAGINPQQGQPNRGSMRPQEIETQQ